VTPATIRKIPVPAEVETIYEVQNAGLGQMEWRPILCETNAKQDLIADIQRALRTKGYTVSVDGVLGKGTMQAVDRYQQRMGLAQGNLTIETIKSLGIDPTG
jgi:peptidoglycan hydrolase-like protein with peptidoglycan-binding domain